MELAALAISPARRAELARAPEDFTPRDEAELVAAMGSPLWRLSHLYYVATKSSDGVNSVVRFRPNAAQRHMFDNIWHRNVVLKARQIGSTTGWCLAALDYALFTPHARVGIIAHTDDAAKSLFRDKIKFAYDRLPEQLKQAIPLERDSATELLLANNSSIRVSTSMRSGTIHFLIVTEFGKICSRFPQRAEEIITGSLPAVPDDGIVVIESTAEGREGAFYEICQRAEALHQQRKPLTKKEFRFFFFPWHGTPEYAMDPAGVVITDEDHDYFDEIEAQAGKIITLPQRAWYVATRENDFAGDYERMWQEYPSIPEESFRASTEGAYYTRQLAQARKEGRICERLPVEAVGCWTFWDIGNSDGTAIWVMQKVGQEYRLIRFYEAWGEPYSHAAQWLQSLGLVFDRHYLPHDADHVRQGQTTNKSPRQMLEELLPGQRFEVVPRVQDINWGIQQVRDVFPLLWFDETECKAGIMHLENYKKRWNERQGCWSDEPDKAGGHSEAADALRQFAQAYAGGLINVRRTTQRSTTPPNWRVA
ncbi:MAG TPA: hypothetical protein VIK69_04770 [Methylophilaceae bacterium]